ncbi:hypothetical protein H7K15_02660 [Mycobacterium parmense]|nr:hypothetical protein [Mycobacterium parmense]
MRETSVPSPDEVDPDALSDVDEAAPEETADDPEEEFALEAEEDAEEDEERPAPVGRVRRGLRRVRGGGKAVSVILIALLLITAGVATWLYFKEYRPDQQTNSGVAATVAGAASDGTVAVLSYSSDSLDQDFANARSHLAGDFLNYYNDFTQQVVTPAAKQKSLKTTAHVTGAAVSELHPDSAVVLVFVDQTTTIKDNPQPSMALSSVLVHMNRINGNWLITKFNPV